MQIDVGTVITAGGLATAISGLVALAWRLFLWIHRVQEMKDEIKALQEIQHKMRAETNEEQALIAYGLLACLKGLQELECDGPVTAAIHKLESHLNAKAHNSK